jgi:hypothetical protein
MFAAAAITSSSRQKSHFSIPYKSISGIRIAMDSKKCSSQLPWHGTQSAALMAETRGANRLEIDH